MTGPKHLSRSGACWRAHVMGPKSCRWQRDPITLHDELSKRLHIGAKFRNRSVVEVRLTRKLRALTDVRQVELDRKDHNLRRQRTFYFSFTQTQREFHHLQRDGSGVFTSLRQDLGSDRGRRTDNCAGNGNDGRDGRLRKLWHWLRRISVVGRNHMHIAIKEFLRALRETPRLFFSPLITIARRIAKSPVFSCLATGLLFVFAITVGGWSLVWLIHWLPWPASLQ